uniref:Inositol-pentakisphosphate 2-kinase n=1 Tax=Jaculus jaculus TaxID=51337 RepID=A0A8C5KL49_JACJA
RMLCFLKFPPNRKKTSEEIFEHLQNIVERLPLEFVKQLCLKIQSERPESFCDKDLDTLSGFAMYLPNLTRLQTYHFAEHRPILCIEINPKCGFIPFSSDVAHEMKHRVCHYYMHQHLKVASGKWKKISKYCPLNLCLGNKQHSLLQEMQNNLRIFKNGELIYGCGDAQSPAADLKDLNHHLQSFCFPSNGLASGPQCTRAVIQDSSEKGRVGTLRPRLRGPCVCEASPFSRSLNHQGKNTSEHSGLLKGCLLCKTLQVQMLDLMDIEGLYPLYNCVERYLEEFPEERKTLQIYGPYDEVFYQKLLDLSTEGDGTVAFTLTKVQQYRVAITAMVCSIMIALSPCLQDASFDQRPMSWLAFSVSVLGRDLKHYKSIPHQHELDNDVVRPTWFKECEACTLDLHKV